ncbi:helix-turn-helix domain-containing protein [Luteolibacter sp. AS25]|uniref:helix-turn-helix domain-containing protein n=1 Tax=Luteolibacter sp. AS25 TaxID=3135776 RepID=UPI00398AC0EF
MKSDTQQFQSTLFERVLRSELLKTYQDAFRCATGLPLRFIDSAKGIDHLSEKTENGSPFCRELNLCSGPCNSCLEVNKRLNEEAAIKGPSSCHCFTGLASSAVPVSCDGAIIGMLRTGQVFHAVPTGEMFHNVSRTLARQGLSEDDLTKLKKAYFQTKVVEPERYQSMITLLGTFGQQLSKHAEQLATMCDGSEPVAVARARKFIEETLADPLPLPLVAQHAGLSESHFCRVFKEATGLTLTDYVNRRRIEWAKKELLKPEARVSEIAFQIGYQSLSQFNRSFSRFTGNSPTNFRREELGKLALQ